MLKQIRCARFRGETIDFHEGLNVVLGDDNATNSIGKSSLLMVIDFALGGGSLVEHNHDVVRELGHHHYFFVFEFDGVWHRYRRGTAEPDDVYRCNDTFEPEELLSVDEYTGILKAAYSIPLRDISFRALTGLYSRIWGKANLDVRNPLNAVPKQGAAECVSNLIKTYDLYGPIDEVARRTANATAKRKALRAAVRQDIVSRVGKRDYSHNEVTITQLEAELDDIKAELAKYATNISELVSNEVLELKLQRDKLVRVRTELNGRLRRTQSSLANHRHIQSKHFAGLVELFPEIDRERLASVEEFHSGLAKILRSELRASEKDLQTEFERVNEAVREIEAQMANTFKAIDEPTHLVDRVYDVATALEKAREENERYEGERALQDEIGRLQEELGVIRREVLIEIQRRLNTGMRDIVDEVFGPGRKSPQITLGETNYTFEVFEDTGTGTAYSSLLVFDLTVFSQTEVPVLVHDSVLFKNIENDSVARLVAFYPKAGKQSFVAIDEVDKYGASAAATLRARKVIQLDNSNVLYDKDWRRPDA